MKRRIQLRNVVYHKTTYHKNFFVFKKNAIVIIILCDMNIYSIISSNYVGYMLHYKTKYVCK